MEVKELLKKLGITEPSDEQVRDAESFAKEQTKGIEESMQKRINALTKEKHESGDKISVLTAEKESFSDKVTKLQEKYDADIQAYSKYKEQFDNLQKERNEKLTTRWKAALEKMNVPETDKRFDKVSKVREKLGIVGIDKPEELKPEEIEKKLELYDIYAETGFIDKIEASGTPILPPASGRPGESPKGGVVSQAAAKMIGKKT